MNRIIEKPVKVGLVTVITTTDDTKEYNDCLWIPSGEFCVWATQCGQEFVIMNGDTPTGNDFKFCMFCGKPLKQEQV